MYAQYITYRDMAWYCEQQRAAWDAALCAAWLTLGLLLWAHIQKVHCIVQTVYSNTTGSTILCCCNQYIMYRGQWNSSQHVCCCRESDIESSDFVKRFDCISKYTQKWTKVVQNTNATASNTQHIIIRMQKQWELS